MTSAPPMEFEKWEGLGNDFVVLRADHEDAVDAATVRAMCDRHRGIGADGVLLVLPSRIPGAIARMRVINADGSVPEMCGNGLRCVVFHVTHSSPPPPSVPVTVDTDAGPRLCTVLEGDGEQGTARILVDMGAARVTGHRLITGSDGAGRDYVLVDVGNPHAVTFGDFDPATIAAAGPAVATDPSFARGTNVEFATMSEGAIDLTVWERGVGLTAACGTGACATVAAACDAGFWKRGEPITVNLPGGALRITLDDRGHALMEGPTRRAFTGTWRRPA